MQFTTCKDQPAQNDLFNMRESKELFLLVDWFLKSTKFGIEKIENIE